MKWVISTPDKRNSVVTFNSQGDLATLSSCASRLCLSEALNRRFLCGITHVAHYRCTEQLLGLCVCVALCKCEAE